MLPPIARYDATILEVFVTYASRLDSIKQNLAMLQGEKSRDVCLLRSVAKLQLYVWLTAAYRLWLEKCLEIIIGDQDRWSAPVM